MMTPAGLPAQGNGPAAVGFRRSVAPTRAILALAVAVGIVVLGAKIGTLGGVVAAAASCIILAWLFRADAVPLVLAALPASALIASNLLTSEMQYLPLASVLAALAIAAAIMVLRREIVLVVPPRAIGLLVVAYCAWAAVATVGSTDPRVSAIYVVGIAMTVTFAFVLMPSLLGSERLREALLGTMGFVALVAALAGFALAVVGPIWWTSRPLGLYLPVELVVLGNQTGIVVPRITGIYQVPSYQGIALAIGLVALLGLASRTSRQVLLATAVVAVALFLTLDRSGWLLAGLGCACVAFYDLPRRPINLAPAFIALLFFGLLGGLTTNAIQAVGRYDVAYAHYSEAARSLPGFEEAGIVTGASPGTGPTDPTQISRPGEGDADTVVVRGGSQLGARMMLWSASANALADRPLVGYGPGLVATAIEPFLTGAAAAYRGLTSHNSWLRTGVEMGIPSVVFLATLIGLLLLRLLRAPRVPRSGPLATSLALLVGIIGTLMFESLFFGGLAYPSFAWTLTAGLGAAELTGLARQAGRGPHHMIQRQTTALDHDVEPQVQGSNS